jgi:RNA polymerase sigma-70 factor (ECF subfamily)
MDAEEFDAFYSGSVRRLTGQMYAVTGDLGDAQDLVHEVNNREAWIFTVAHRLATSRWRRSQVARRALHKLGPAPPAPPPSEDHLALITALRRLPKEQREAIALHHLCDLSLNQVAEAVGAPVGTVKARLSRGRAALAILLETEPTHA